ncbi:hypothetical protein I4F81_008518 [Pyropia yezoensis]|uniref:Uncharacterized protein n=1 Tax=Pyropia yezoensis TaxID=2788 RepID=A0ACC3C745_PYRYE|nr:hypothetical protein I4F81_008518 [Neopyropia yezoensis]
MEERGHPRQVSPHSLQQSQYLPRPRHPRRLLWSLSPPHHAPPRRQHLPRKNCTRGPHSRRRPQTGGESGTSPRHHCRRRRGRRGPSSAPPQRPTAVPAVWTPPPSCHSHQPTGQFSRPLG